MGRLASLIGLLLLCWIELDTATRREAGGGFGGYVFLTVAAVALGLIVLRPSVALGQSGEVRVRHVVGSTTFHVGDVVDVGMDEWGLVVRLRDGQLVRSIVFQATASVGEPRWFDIAQALTGKRPRLSADDEWDDEGPG